MKSNVKFALTKSEKIVIWFDLFDLLIPLNYIRRPEVVIKLMLCASGQTDGK